MQNFSRTWYPTEIALEEVEDFAFGSRLAAAALAFDTTIPEVEDDLDVIGLPDH